MDHTLNISHQLQNAHNCSLIFTKSTMHIQGESPNLCVVGIWQMNANIKKQACKHDVHVGGHLLMCTSFVDFRAHNQDVRKCRIFNLQDRQVVWFREIMRTFSWFRRWKKIGNTMKLSGDIDVRKTTLCLNVGCTAILSNVCSEMYINVWSWLALVDIYVMITQLGSKLKFCAVMGAYTNEEMWEMVVIFGECNRSVVAAANEYARHFPNSRHQIIDHVNHRLQETGIFISHRARVRTRTVTADAACAAVLAFFHT